MVLRSVVKTIENMCTKLKKSIACRDVPIMWKTAVSLWEPPETADQQRRVLCLHFNRHSAVVVLAQIIMFMGQ